jgi:hypothetical protein
MSVRLTCLLALLLPTAAVAQSEGVLRDYFEGQTVTLKIAMPGTEDGVDVYPGNAKPIDFPRHASRLKKFGTALRSGDQALVTKIKLKGDHIEFQLDGGGYGTMGDETSSNVGVTAAPKTKREQNLEGELRRETDPARRRAIKEELDDLKADREREDARNRAAVAEAEESKKSNIRERRLQSGSRFNIRYRDVVPASAMTPDGVKQALAAYLDFLPGATRAAGNDPIPGVPAAGEPGPPKGGLPSKGMLLPAVDQQLGPPRKTSDRAEGKLKVTTRVYDTPDGVVTAEFVEGVLIRFGLTSR